MKKHQMTLDGWKGIKVVENIADLSVIEHVDTLEGNIGPLIFGDKGTAHFINMPAGLFLGEHEHSTEAFIYTVQGRWVLCNNGVRKIMQAGSLFWFQANASTGYEVPFDEDAYILIFKSERGDNTEEKFLEYLYGLKERLEKEHSTNTPYLLSELPSDHPARIFATNIKK
ncbi:MAG TPA: cupin domain-containing protein [Clostridiaceae bacterium]|nr:cupin domain-containing protein [Clostridiaceae bacterium]